MKIAILLHGLLRSWKECSTVFSYYSKLYPDVEFDFYLSTWKNALVIPPHKGVKEKFSSNTNLKLKAYSIHDELEIQDNLAPHFTPTINLPVEKLPNYTPQYTFLKSKVCELVKEDYDICILARCDIFIYKEALDIIVNSNYDLGPNIIYNESGTEYAIDSLFCSRDLFWYGSPEAILKHKDCFSDCYVDCLLPPKGIHKYCGSWLNFKQIYNYRVDALVGTIVRSNDYNSKTGVPTKQNLSKLINKHGIDLYKFTIRDFREYLWK